MEWAYIQIASLVVIVSFLAYIGIADYRLSKDTK